MAFLREPEPVRYVATEVVPGVRRLVAPNPGPMTYHGTNTWLVEAAEGLTVIDPGPEDAGHLAAILACGRVAQIVLTHTHPDHFGGALPLRAATGAPIYGWGVPWVAGFVPDVALSDGAQLGRLMALHTPGHASDHVCFALAGAEGILFSGDHVMSWSTSVVSPPDGDMGAYMASLRLLLAREDALYLCGHGAPLPNPRGLVRGMLAHRAGREARILAVLGGGGVVSADGLVGVLYPGLEARLVGAARRTVLAHVEKLRGEGRVVIEAEGWVAAGEASPAV
jgi:glyoxylase-like metal-dependent hydrolase (beta-lactamase superfamily II)